MTLPLPPEVLHAWGLAPNTVERLTSGHINRTYVATSNAGKRLVVQRLNPAIFQPEVNDDLEAITDHLAAQGILTPRLVRTRQGAPWVKETGIDTSASSPESSPKASVWRALTHIDGETVDAADSPERCAAAGRLLGVFHHALGNCAFVLRHRRLGIHDTPKHLAALRRALQAHRDHRAFTQIAPLGKAILAAAEELELPTSLPERLVHGDPKITNILFDRNTGEARCLVDLDTLARMPLALELGDALRSWCAPRGEEEPDPIDVARFEATLQAYATSAPPAAWLGADEWRAIVPATETIALELAARFATDALDERYFGWDATRFPSASAHNQRRAKAQLALARSIRHQRDALQAIVDDIW